MVRKMTNKELNRALAKLMGYMVVSEIGPNDMTIYTLVRPSGKHELPTISEDLAYAHAPDYCADASASLEIQTAAISKDAQMYVTSLYKIVSGESSALYTDFEVASILSATLRQISEAAYAVLRGGS